MKVFILILLISYILSLDLSNNSTSKKLLDLTLYSSLSYSGDYPSLSILDVSGLEEGEVIYISYHIGRSSFDAKLLNYEFTDVYPDEYFECKNQIELSRSMGTTSSSRSSKKRKTVKKTIAMDLYFEIKKQNKKYLVLENLLFKGYNLKVTHHKYNPIAWIIIVVVFAVVFWIGVGSFFLYNFCKNKKRTKSSDIDFKKEEPSPLYPPNESYDSTQANTIPMQQQPPYVPQPIPPEVLNSNETGYSSGMSQQEGYSSGIGQQGYYSGMAVQPLENSNVESPKE
jgi:hypothetical protein